jgi:transcription elongation factor Elf1
LYRNNGFANVKCGSCGIEQTIDKLTPLTEPVDIYGDFIDRFYESREVEV